MVEYPDDTREELAEFLANQCHRAKREIPVTRRFTTDPLTAYDVRHDTINNHLDDYEACEQ